MKDFKRFLSREYQGSPITDWLELYAGVLILAFVGLLFMTAVGYFFMPGEAVRTSLASAFSCFCVGMWCSYFSDWAKDEPDHEYLRVGVSVISGVFLIVCVCNWIPENWTSFSISTRDIVIWCIITVSILIAQWPTSSEDSNGSSGNNA